MKNGPITTLIELAFIWTALISIYVFRDQIDLILYLSCAFVFSYTYYNFRFNIPYTKIKTNYLLEMGGGTEIVSTVGYVGFGIAFILVLMVNQKQSCPQLIYIFGLFHVLCGAVLNLVIKKICDNAYYRFEQYTHHRKNKDCHRDEIDCKNHCRYVGYY